LDSRKISPEKIAPEKKPLGIVFILLKIDPRKCFLNVCNAVIYKGHVYVKISQGVNLITENLTIFVYSTTTTTTTTGDAI